MDHQITQLYNTYGPMVYRRCLSLVKDHELAMDCMQDVFVRLLKAHSRLEPGGFSSLLYTMATRVSLNALRGISRRERGKVSWDIALSEARAPDSPEEDAMQNQVIQQVLSLGDEKTRTIAWLHYADGYTLEETAQAVGMSVSGIRKRLRVFKDKAAVVKEHYHGTDL